MSGSIENDSLSSHLPKPKIHLWLSNVAFSFSVGCSLDVNRIVRQAYNVEMRRPNEVRMCLRKPSMTTLTIYKSGKINGVGATSEKHAYKCARQVARILQKLKFNVRLLNFRVHNILASCPLPFQINLNRFLHLFSNFKFVFFVFVLFIYTVN